MNWGRAPKVTSGYILDRRVNATNIILSRDVVEESTHTHSITATSLYSSHNFAAETSHVQHMNHHIRTTNEFACYVKYIRNVCMYVAKSVGKVL